MRHWKIIRLVIVKKNLSCLLLSIDSVGQEDKGWCGNFALGL